MKKDSYYNDLGLFRFGLIAPAINKTHDFTTNNEYFRDISLKKHIFNGKEYKFSLSCLKNWYYKYKRDGFNSLTKKKRNDYKTSHKLKNDTINRIITLREQYPSISGTAIYKKLIQEQYINKLEVSLNTVLRFLKSNNLKASQVMNIERRMFECENVNDCWQSDTSDGPYITIDDKKYRTKLIMFIDDKSRMIMGFDFFLNDTAIICKKFLKMQLKLMVNLKNYLLIMVALMIINNYH